jgi:hypothetical protein
VRNDETRAAGRLKPYFKMGSDLHSDVAYPSLSSYRGSGLSCPREDATA